MLFNEIGSMGKKQLTVLAHVFLYLDQDGNIIPSGVTDEFLPFLYGKYQKACERKPWNEFLGDWLKGKIGDFCTMSECGLVESPKPMMFHGDIAFLISCKEGKPGKIKETRLLVDISPVIPQLPRKLSPEEIDRVVVIDIDDDQNKHLLLDLLWTCTFPSGKIFIIDPNHLEKDARRLLELILEYCEKESETGSDPSSNEMKRVLEKDSGWMRNLEIISIRDEILKKTTKKEIFLK